MRSSAGRWGRAAAVLLGLLVSAPAVAQSADRPAYRLFTSAGKPVAYGKMTKALAGADVVLFGEEHNNAIAHWLELQVARDLLRVKGDKLVLGAEMFERDVQPVLAAYVSVCDSITEKDLTEKARPWPNYATDYRPLVELARANRLRFIGTNIPRPYAREVAQKGLDATINAGVERTADQEQLLPPLPLRVDMQRPAYQKMRALFGSDEAHGGGGAGIDRMIAAQALKDATMAHFIATGRAPGELLLHFNGSFHSDDHSGICEYLLAEAPGTKLLTISTVSQDDLGKLEKENHGKADYILVVPADMTKTY